MGEQIIINDENDFYKDKSDEMEPNGTDVPDVRVMSGNSSLKRMKTRNDVKNNSPKKASPKAQGSRNKKKSPEMDFIEDVQKIYDFFNNKIPYEQILFAIHYNEG